MESVMVKRYRLSDALNAARRAYKVKPIQKNLIAFYRASDTYERFKRETGQARQNRDSI